MHDPAELYINISQETWAFILPPKKDFWALLGLFTALSFYENHVNNTETLGKGKEFTYKNFKYISVHWDRCQAKSGKLMFVANYTIVDWDPMVCGYLTVQMILIALYVIMLLK